MQSPLLDPEQLFIRAAVLLAASGVWLWPFPCARCQGAEFHVQGTSVTTIYTDKVVSGTNVAREETGDFSVSVRSGSQWLIRFRKVPWQADELDLGCDGGDIYEYELLQSRAKREAARAGRAPLNTGIAETHPGPVGDAEYCEEGTVLWWAFLSNRYLEGRERAQASRLPLIFTPDPRLRFFDTAARSHWRRMHQPPFLLDRLDQENGGWEWYWRDPDNGPYVMPPSQDRYPGPAAKGFTNVVYRVDATSSLGALLLPVRFHLEWFMPKMRPTGSGGSRSSLWKHYSFVVTNLSEEADVDSFTPKVVGVTTVADRRFVLSKPRLFKVDYFATNRWLSSSEVKSLPQYARAVRYASGAAARLVGRAPLSRPGGCSFGRAFWVRA